MSKKMRGVTLIELVIAVVIVGVLLAIAVPSYQKYVKRGRRMDAQVEMTAAAQRAERFFTANNTYTGAPAARSTPFYNITIVTSNKTVANPVPPPATITINGGAYTLTATPQGNQANDRCGNLTLDSDGVKSSTGTLPGGEPCWY